ncbi:MAG: Fe-S cluster assembly protein SufD [Aestuariivirga sp.]|uniref:Fe-S cluster assembly protein SufD n=1 Tax=Aestuariivirga sp. TaxID=2650926 RepID=UPI0025BF3D52|nr:Fe-S cluster assembly protein SufD [Aestuariivirga sp.]MCA3561264.1 Fe-S cluster assembly protein SufD [Aestuariivirga sp.]
MNAAIARTAAEEALGFHLPNRRMEEWRWTDLRQLIDKPYPPRQKVEAKGGDVERLLASSPFAGVAATRMVFVNGEYDAKHSKQSNAFVESTAALDDPVNLMNVAFATDGARLRIEGNVDTPIEFVFISTDASPRTVATRNVIEIADDASATIIETHLGEGSYLANSVTEIRIGHNARLDRVKVELESHDAVHLAHAHVIVDRNAAFRDFTLTAGAKLNRQNGTFRFIGEFADAKVSGAYLLAGKQHADTRLVVGHEVANCASRELFKCVMDGHARGIFQGKVIVRPGAQKTDGKQSSHALLLSETAEFDAKPELEIYADDVACGHGATSGDLNHDHVFYLKSRGIPEAEAKALLIAAFVGEAFDTVHHDGIRAALEDFAARWLTERRRKG